MKDKCTNMPHFAEEVDACGFLVILRPAFQDVKATDALSFEWNFEKKKVDDHDRVCDHKMEDGSFCQYWCPNVRSYVSHMWQTHKVRPTVYELIVSTKCPYCERICASRQSLKTHLKLAQRKGKCPDPIKAHHYKAYCADLQVFTEEFSCALCGAEDFTGLDQYHAHCRIHHSLEAVQQQ